MRHISEETLEQYCMGRLPQTETEPVEDHLLICNLCQDSLAETEEFILVIRAAAEELQRNPVPEPWWRTLWSGLANGLTAFPKPALAAAACALALFVIIPKGADKTATVQLQAMRGPESAAQAPANATLTLRLPLGGVDPTGNLEVRVADSAGNIVQRAKADKADGQAVATVKGLSSGIYWARVYSGEEMLVESGLNVR